jgi:catechol 2,3-dioxygenase-like lactoylglutathione lyase family enzyme
MNNSLKPTLLGVHIKCADINKSLEFYTSLGFTPTFAYGDEGWKKEILKHNSNATVVDEKYNGANFKITDSALVEIADGHAAVKPEVFRQPVTSSKISMYFDVENIERIKDIAIAQKYAIAKDITTYPWGTDEIVLRDPDGAIVVFRCRHYEI